MQGDFTDALQAQLKMKQILLGSAVEAKRGELALRWHLQ